MIRGDWIGTQGSNSSKRDKNSLEFQEQLKMQIHQARGQESGLASPHPIRTAARKFSFLSVGSEHELGINEGYNEGK